MSLGQESPDYPDCQENANSQKDRSPEIGAAAFLGSRRRHEVVLQFVVLHEALILERSFRLEPAQGHLAGKDHRIHWKAFRPQMRMEKVEYEYKSGRQQRFITMNQIGGIDRPSGQEAHEEHRKPQHQTGQAHEEDAPEEACPCGSRQLMAS